MLNFPVKVADLNTAYLYKQEKSKHGKHRKNYHRDYYLKNREKFLTYSRDYYGVKKLLAPYLKGEKMVLNNFLSHTRSSLTFTRKNKELFFFFFLGMVLKKLGAVRKNWNGD